MEDIEPLEPNGHGGDGLQAVERLILFLSETDKVGFQLDCLLLATGAGYRDGISMTEVARKWGCTKQAVSKRCVALCRLLQLPPSSNMRAESTKESFRQANRRNLPKLC